MCPLSKDFVTCSRLQPPGVLMKCPSSEDFVSCNRLQPPRASMICPSLEDFVHAMDFDHQESQWTAPHWRTLSRATDFDYKGPQWSALHRRTLSRTNEGLQPYHKLQTGTSQRTQQHRWRIKRMHYLDGGGRICVGRLVDDRMITALDWGQRLDPKSL